ncbi:MAG: hypothetical protein ACTSYG_08455 [Candidatus Heimdallarchaeota archaeon]
MKKIEKTYYRVAAAWQQRGCIQINITGHKRKKGNFFRLFKNNFKSSYKQPDYWMVYIVTNKEDILPEDETYILELKKVKKDELEFERRKKAKG